MPGGRLRHVQGHPIRPPTLVSGGLDRRAFLATVTGIAAAARLPHPSHRRRGKTRLILLGTGGGPRPRTVHTSPSQVIVSDELLYVVDCGDGVAQQLVAARLSLAKLRHVFITHHHSDHNADYGNLLLLSWASGLATRVDTWGPPPIERITRLFLEMSAYDIETRMADEGRAPLVPLIHVHELRNPGVLLRDEGLKVSCALVDHPPVTPALGYRFDGPDRSIVISGDTKRSDNLARLAEGADILIHEALYVPAVDRLAARVPYARRLKQHLLATHTPVEDCGRVAAAAGVKTLVLSHLVPADDPSISDEMWINAARPYFKGEIIVARDLMEL